MKRLISMISILAFASNGFSSAGQAPQERLSFRVYAEAFLSIPPTEKNLLLLSAIAGATESDLSVLHTDLSEHPYDPSKIKMSLKNNQFLFNEKAAGIEIVSDSPVTLKMGNSKWSYDKAKSYRSNYLALKTIFSRSIQHRGSASLNLLIPQASAQTKWEIFRDDLWAVSLLSTVASALSGTYTTSLVGYAFAGLPLSALGGMAGPAAIGLLIGIFLGVAYGLIDANFISKTGVPRKEIVDVLLVSKPKLKCSSKPREMEISPSSEHSRLKVVVSPLSKDPAKQVKLIDLAGIDASSSVTDAQRKTLVALAKFCETPEDAAKISAFLKAKAEMVVASLPKAGAAVVHPAATVQ